MDGIGQNKRIAVVGHRRRGQRRRARAKFGCGIDGKRTGAGDLRRNVVRHRHRKRHRGSRVRAVGSTQHYGGHAFVERKHAAARAIGDAAHGSRRGSAERIAPGRARAVVRYRVGDGVVGCATVGKHIQRLVAGVGERGRLVIDDRHRLLAGFGVAAGIGGRPGHCGCSDGVISRCVACSIETIGHGGSNGDCQFARNEIRKGSIQGHIDRCAIGARGGQNRSQGCIVSVGDTLVKTVVTV